jgi:hypothetical protein
MADAVAVQQQLAAQELVQLVDAHGSFVVLLRLAKARGSRRLG